MNDLFNIKATKEDFEQDYNNCYKKGLVTNCIDYNKPEVIFSPNQLKIIDFDFDF